MNRNHPVLPTGEIFCLGFGLGAAYFLVNLISFFPGEQLFLMSSSLLKMNLFIYSFCIWTLGFLLLSLAAHAVTAPLVLFGRHPALVPARRFVVHFLMFLVFSAGWAVWTATQRPAAQSPRGVQARGDETRAAHRGVDRNRRGRRPGFALDRWRQVAREVPAMEVQAGDSRDRRLRSLCRDGESVARHRFVAHRAPPSSTARIRRRPSSSFSMPDRGTFCFRSPRAAICPRSPR